MNTSRMALTIGLIGTIGAGLWFYNRADAGELPAFRFATVERTTLESTVSATGSLSAVRTVQVGTQVSGQVSALYVDFNDKVKKGQLLARIDPTLQQQAVAESQAALERAEAQFAQAKAEYDRNLELFNAKIVTESEFNTIQATYAVAKSNVRSAQISLDRTRQNLAYTSIYAPIDGVIVSRAVDAGQTVAASLATPELFRIAEDLTEMQILASVDESDIGKIAVGQPVTFTVAAYQSRAFTGTVNQLRLQSAITDNVVNYTVVVSVGNKDGKLLPGMTATVKFLTSRAENVLAVSSAALRFTPTAAMLGADSVLLTRAPGARPAGAPAAGALPAGAPPTGMPPMGAAPAGAMPGMAGGAAARVRRPGADSSATLWVADSNGKLTPRRVRTGLSDGQKTQISGRDLEAGVQVVIGTTAGTTAAATTTSSNPFQQTQQRGTQGGQPRPPGAF